MKIFKSLEDLFGEIPTAEGVLEFLEKSDSDQLLVLLYQNLDFNLNKIIKDILQKRNLQEQEKEL